jgi:hypothetical protein
MGKADVILHPTRLRIIQTFGGGRCLTAQQLATLVPDIPRASLYRHLHLLVDAGILAVVEEHPARAIQERVYALVENAANVGPTDYAGASAEDQLRHFTAFLEVLHSDFTRYLQHHQHHDAPTAGPGAGVAYYQMPVYVTDEEYLQLVATLQAVLRPVVAQRPAPQRRRRLLSIIAMPGMEEDQTSLLAADPQAEAE